MPKDGRSGDASAEAEALRNIPHDLYRAVYRPGASDREVDALRHALVDAGRDRTDELPAATTSSPHLRRAGRRAPASALLTSALLLGILGLVIAESQALPAGRPSTKPATSLGSPFAASVPVPLLGDVENRQRQEVALAQLFSRPAAADLQVFLLHHHFSGSVESLERSDAVHGSAVGGHTFDLGKIAVPATARMTVLLTCDRPSAFTWRLVAPGAEHDDPTFVRSRGQRCYGHVMKATVRVRSGQVPTHLEVGVPRDVRTVVTVVAGNR